MNLLFEYFTPPLHASQEWLDGYYAALNQVGALLIAEANEQMSGQSAREVPSLVASPQLPTLRRYSYTWRGTERP